MKIGASERKISQFFRTLGQPVRLQILLAIGRGEACVCHLEAALGLRQAYISQHLMALRKNKILQTRREGRFIFYRLENPKILDLIHFANELASTAVPVQPLIKETTFFEDCVCPTCAPAA